MTNHRSGPPGQRPQKLVLRKIQRSGPLPPVAPPPRRDGSGASAAPLAPMRPRFATLPGVTPHPPQEEAFTRAPPATDPFFPPSTPELYQRSNEHPPPPLIEPEAHEPE